MEERERQLLDLATEFLGTQQSLLAAWRQANPSSRDMEMLLDFPKRCVVHVQSNEWSATRHGLGVRFVRTDGVTVDVPYGVHKPLALDANRLFDFLASRPLTLFGLVPRNRQDFYMVFDKLCESGHMISEPDAAGRTLYAIHALEPGCSREDQK